MAASPQYAQPPSPPDSKDSKSNASSPASSPTASSSASAASPPVSPNGGGPKLSGPVSDGDPTMVLSRTNVAAAKADSSGRVYRLYCDGIFDLFHLGHMRMLEQAKKSLGDPARVHLIAGVNSDVDTQKFKGKTVMDHRTRIESVRHCKWVDEVAEDAPWVVTQPFLDKYQIDFVCHDALPYKDTSGVSADGDVYAGIKKMGKFLETQRTVGISTSDLIVTICRDYDDYIKRNLERGYTPEELGVGNTWALRSAAHDKRKKVDAKMKVVRTEMGAVSQAARDFVAQFNPKWLVDREPIAAADGERHVRFTPKIMVQHLKTVPAKSSQVLHHSIGLAKALFDLSWNCMSYVIPCCYCGSICTKRKKKK